MDGKEDEELNGVAQLLAFYALPFLGFRFTLIGTMWTNWYGRYGSIVLALHGDFETRLKRISIKGIWWNSLR